MQRELLPVTLDDMIAEVKRELEMRAHWYPQWKAKAGIVKRNQMDRQWDVMEAILKFLEEANGRQMGERHQAK
jgi:hypothetical protein